MSIYTDLIARILQGPFYQADGRVIPFQDGLTSLVYDTSTPLQRYGVYLDDAFSGEAVADSLGTLIVELQLTAGNHTIMVEDDLTGQRTYDYVAVQNRATIMSAIADVITTYISDQTEAIYNARSLRDVGTDYIDTVYGRLVDFGNSSGWSLESYRTALRAFRQAYRNFATHPRGTTDILSATLGARPLLVPKSWRPSWRLNHTLADNGAMLARTLTSPRMGDLSIAGVDWPTINARSLTYVATGFTGAALVFAGTITQPASVGRAERLSVTFGAGWDRGNVVITGRDAGGTLVSETFVATVSTTVGGLVYFQSITTIEKTLAGTAGTATVGLRDRRFVSLAEINSNEALSGETLDYTISPATLMWGTYSVSPVDVSTVPTAPATTIRYELPGNAETAFFTGINAAPYNTVGATRTRLAFDGLPPVDIDITSGAAVAAATVVTDINTAIGASAPYTAASASYATIAGTTSANYVRFRTTATPIVRGATARTTIYPSAYATPNVGDAARIIFGVPRNLGYLSANYSAGTSVSLSSSTNLPEAPFQARIGRGRRLNASLAGAVVDASTLLAEFTLTGAVTTVGDVGGYVLISNTASTNDGLHPIVSVDRGTNVCTLRHGTGGLFTAGTFPVASWTIYSMGELVDVAANNRGTGVLTLDAAAPDVVADGTSYQLGSMFEIATDMPYTVQGTDAFGGITVDVDPTLAPAAPTSDIVASWSGVNLADRWRPLNAPTVVRVYGGSVFNDFRTVAIVTASGEPTFEVTLEPETVASFRGWRVRAAFVVQNHAATAQNFHIDRTLDGTTFDTGANVSVPSTAIDTTTGFGPIVPTIVSRDFEVPYDATDVRVRLVFSNTTVGVAMTLHACYALALTTPESTTTPDETVFGYFLGNGTVIRSVRRDVFGRLVYAFSPDDMDALTEDLLRGQLGLPTRTSGATTASPQGHISTIEPVQNYVERIGRPPDAVVGCYDPTEWGAATLENMELTSDNPLRLSRVSATQPSFVSREYVAFPATAPYVATLSLDSVHDAFPENPDATDVLLAVPRNQQSGDVQGATIPTSGTPAPWEWIAADQIELDSAEYNAANDYYVSYTIPVRATTDVIDMGVDLGANWDDFLWLFDCPFFARCEPDQRNSAATVGVTFDAQLIAPLPEPADRAVIGASLVRDNGRQRSTLPSNAWRFVDDNNIQLVDRSQYATDNIYELTYTVKYAVPVQVPQFVFEIRSATSAIGVAAAVWESIEPDAVVNIARNDTTQAGTLRYHQLRATVSNVVLTDDFALYGLGFRGVRLRGTAPDAPGIVQVV
jgi:hypothetical protein